MLSVEPFPEGPTSIHRTKVVSGDKLTGGAAGVVAKEEEEEEEAAGGIVGEQCLHMPFFLPLGPLHDLRAPPGF